MKDVAMVETKVVMMAAY